MCKRLRDLLHCLIPRPAHEDNTQRNCERCNQQHNGDVCNTQMQIVTLSDSQTGAAQDQTEEDDLFFPELVTWCLPEDRKVTTPPPYVLSEEYLKWLHSKGKIPEELQTFSDWTLAYSSDLHGYSLQTLYRRCACFMGAHEFRDPCLLMVKDSVGDCFAALMSHLPHISTHTYGLSSETRIFNLTTEVEKRRMYKPSEGYQALVIGNSEMLNIGIDGRGRIAITIFDGLTRGHLQACDAFEGLEENNLVETEDQWIDIEVVELWSFKSPQRN